MEAKVEFIVEQARPDENMSPRVIIPPFSKTMEFKAFKKSSGAFSAVIAGITVRVDSANYPKLVLIYVDADSDYPVSVTWAETSVTGYDAVVVQPGRFLMVKSSDISSHVTLAGVGGTSTGKYILLA